MKPNTSNKEEHKLEEAMIKMRDIKQKAYLEGIKQGYAKAIDEEIQLLENIKGFPTIRRNEIIITSLNEKIKELKQEIAKLKEKKA